MNMTDPCLRWVSGNNVDMGSALSCPNRYNPPIDIFVARGASADNVILGKYVVSHQIGYHAINGAAATINNPEFLVVSKVCAVDWVTDDSASTDPFPTGAIVGGWLKGIPLYIGRKYQVYPNARLEDMSIGYFDRVSDLGHMTWGPSDVTMKVVEILVLRNGGIAWPNTNKLHGI